MRNLLKFALSSVLLQGLFSCSSCANVENDMSSNIIYNLQSKAETRKLIHIECLLLIKYSTYGTSENGDDVLHQTDLECLFDGAAAPIPFINMPAWLSDKMDNNEIVSNSDSLQLSEVLLSNEGLSIPPGAQASVRQGENRRRLAAATTGRRSVVVLRTNMDYFGDVNGEPPTYSTGELSDMFFSTDGDAFNMNVMYDQCSYSALTFYPGTGDNVSNGVIDLGLLQSPEGNESVQGYILKEAGDWSFNNSPPYDHIIISYQSYPFHSFGSYRNHWLSTCSGPYCEYPQSQVRCLAANFADYTYFSSIADTSLGNQDFSDDTCMMSGKFEKTPDGPIRCFNAVKNWYLGWYSDRHATIESGRSGLYRVFGITDYQAADDVVIILITGADKPIFVSYNRQNSFNSGIGEGGDKVLVHTKERDASDPSGDSKMVAILAPGESTTVFGNLISYLNAESNHALVQIGGPEAPSASPSKPPPSPQPTPPPTPAPVPPTPPPTSSPTTSSPTSSPTTLSKSPTQSPASTPSSSPTTWSKSPTQAPTSTLCENTPGWKFVKKNGKEKGCNWFAKKKQRCNKKSGGMENCPESCNVCEKSGVQLCENRELRKKVCKSVSCCTWDRDSKSCKSNVGQSKCF